MGVAVAVEVFTGYYLYKCESLTRVVHVLLTFFVQLWSVASNFILSFSLCLERKILLSLSKTQLR